jgi:hypothetical protein
MSARTFVLFSCDLEFASPIELSKRMGCPRHYWVRAAVKELIDSSLAAAWMQAAAGEVRADADQRARDLQHDPTAERQWARNEAAQQVELLDLQIARLRRDLEAAEQTARGEEQHNLLTEHSHAQTRVAEHEQKLFEGLRIIEEALEGLADERNQTRRRQGRLKAAGWDLHSLQLNLKPSCDWQQRVEALSRAYAKVTHPIMGS